DLEQRSIQQSKGSVQLRQLQREAEANRLIYENFLTRFKETSEQEDLQQADARLISPAKEGRFAGVPDALILGGTGILGLILGFGLLFLFEQLNNTFRSEDEVEDKTGVGVLASLPRFGRRRRRSQVLDYVRENPTSSLAEGIRNLRTALLLSNVDKPPKVIMVTSSLPAEGKSTTCMLLAEMSTLMGKKAIIVDCDIRRPTLHKTFNVKNEHDIISVLDGSAELEEVIYKDPESDLHVLPAVQSAPQAADILSSQRFADLVQALAERYDIVLLDSPPILLVSDASVVGNHADAAIYAVHWDKTPREAATRGLKQLRDLGIHVNGVVLTLVDRKRQSQYSYYRYGYSYYQNDYYVD
ncbi:MAG: polysaccharide biosynthesis tyrosine autokinase, partial [Pseudomonadota bacterium]